ncbi:MAG: flagellar M-ring protein FliF [Firmicutes bacterium]|nr:flagellar M-ring protein FliF [Bacillota bacterium]
MNTKVKEFWSKGKEKTQGFLSGLSKTAKFLIGAAAATVVVVIIVVAIMMGNRPYTVLFTELEAEEANSIIAYLEEQQVSCRLEGDTIYVKSSQEERLKAQLLMEGYPTSGYAYENYLENSSLMSTNSERAKAFLIALQERMEAVIENFDGVKDARVTITESEDRRYVLDASNLVDATAGIQVTMRSGATLTEKQAAAIRQLLAHSVKGLQIENVSISDTKGNTYSGISSSGSGDLGEGSALKLRLEEQVNNRVRNNIISVLSGPFGEENVQVAVSSTVDVSRQITESEDYTAPEGLGEDGRGLIGKEVWYDQVIRDGEVSGAGGVVGTEENSDLTNFPEYVEGQLRVDGDEKAIISQGEKDYDNNKTTQQTERVGGIVTDISIAVTINSQNGTAVNTATLQNHVARAAGLSPEQEDGRVSIWITDFGKGGVDSPSGVGFFYNIINTVPLYVLIGAGILLILLLFLVIYLILRSRKKKKERLAPAAAPTLEEEILAMANAIGDESGEQPAAEAPKEGADIMDVNAEKSMELRKSVRQFVSNNPEIAAQIVRAWMKGGDEQ